MTLRGKCLLILNILTRIQRSNCQVAQIHMYNYNNYNSNNNNNNNNNNDDDEDDDDKNNKLIVGFGSGHFLRWIFLSTASSSN